MDIATEPTQVETDAAAPSAEADEALIWLPIEGAILHLRQMGLPYSRATIYRNYARDEVDGLTHFGVPIGGEEAVPEDRDVADSEVVVDDDSHVMLVPNPSSATQDLAASLAADQARLLRILESQERVIESQSRTIEAQQERFSLTDGERHSLSEQVLALKAATDEPTQVTIRGPEKRWYQFWR